MTNKPQMRLRKSDRTRAAIIQAALDLYRQSAFDDVTLEQIARRAQVHKQTVLRYFDSKGDIALALGEERLQRFVAGLEDPARTANTITFWRNGVRAFVGRLAEGGDHLRMQRFIEETPELVARSLMISRRYERALAASFEQEAGVPAGDLESRMLACLLVGANHPIIAALAASRAYAEMERELLRVIDIAAERFPARAGKVGGD